MSDDRVPMNVREGTRDRLNRLLMTPDLHGVGYSDFVAAAMNAYDRGEWKVGTEPVQCSCRGGGCKRISDGPDGLCTKCREEHQQDEPSMTAPS